MRFTLRDPYAFDYETNMVDSATLDEYRKYYEILESVKLILPEGQAAWNPPKGVVAFYGSMLAGGVIRSIQPYIARFLCDAKISLVQLEPNGYWQLLSLWSLWSANNEPTPSSCEVKHIFVLKGSNRGTYFLTSVGAEKLLSQGANPKLKASDIEVGTTSDKKGFLCGCHILNKFWKNNWFFMVGNLGRDVTEDSVIGHPIVVISRHFMKHFTWMDDSQDLRDDEVHRVVRMVTRLLSERDGARKVIVRMEQEYEYWQCYKLGRYCPIDEVVTRINKT
ncbi:hypothetical protein Q3G72_010539 [Acer saccharum]|nr:hypothetical protein Q3G72_010539 [Acer saccharum]